MSATRGRKPAHPELKKICTEAAKAVKFEGGEARHEVYMEDAVLRGVTHCTWASALDDLWFVKFSMGGKQFTLGPFALYEATRIYDAMFVLFREYRVHMPDALLEKSWLNWPRQQAEDDIKSNEPLRWFLSALKNFWERNGYLKSAEARADGKRERARAYALRRSTPGLVETWGVELRHVLYTVLEELETVKKQLAEIRKCVKIPTIDITSPGEHQETQIEKI